MSAKEIARKEKEREEKIKVDKEEKLRRAKEKANKNPDQKQEKKVKKRVVADIDIIENDEELVEVDESKEPATLVFIGHVDSGKSTISGNLMYKMGIVDSRTI